MSTLTRRRALIWLGIITLIGGALRFKRLAWGAPYYHFHMDEHYVFMGADLLRNGLRQAAMSGKFFMYGPLPMYMVDVLRWLYGVFAHPLNLSVHQDEITYMVMGRAIAASFSTAIIPVMYAIATRVAGRLAGLLSATFAALSVLLIRDAHFFTVDMPMTFLCMVTWLLLLHMAESGSILVGIGAGMTLAAAITAKYTAVFMLVPLALAHVLSPQRPTTIQPYGGWGRWVLRGMVPLAACVVTFLLLDPLVWLYWDKFLYDVRTQITEPLSGATRPIFFAHFFDLAHPRLYWFTNLLWWGMGPVLEIVSLAGVIRLLTRNTKPALLSATVAIAYFAIAGNSVAPFVRYTIPLVASLSVAAGVLCADLLGRPAWRSIGAVVTAVTIASSAAYSAAYMNIFRAPDSRVAAAEYLRQEVPYGANVLVEPQHNIPPMGSYFRATDFYKDYVLWGRFDERLMRFRLFGFDTYRYLYDLRPSQAEKQAYIAGRLERVDWIVMDDTYVQWYDHLPEKDYGVVKQYYRDLFAGRLGFHLDRTFKVYPSLLGYEINDDNAELSFRLFDHPRIFIFKRTL